MAGYTKKSFMREGKIEEICSNYTYEEIRLAHKKLKTERKAAAIERENKTRRCRSCAHCLEATPYKSSMRNRTYGTCMFSAKYGGNVLALPTMPPDFEPKRVSVAEEGKCGHYLNIKSDEAQTLAALKVRMSDRLDKE